MKAKRSVIRLVQFGYALLLACSGMATAFGAVQTVSAQNDQPVTFEVARTNWVQRARTNVIEIQMPKVVIVNEFRTNFTVSIITNVIDVNRTRWVDQFTTNITSSIHTNWVTKMLTNAVTLERHKTNVIDRVTTNVIIAYSTNWVTRILTNTLAVDQYLTNRIDAYSTNLVTRTRTNILVVEQVRTNQLNAYRTNLAVLNVTNWETVLVMKTNWVTQPVTNVVAIDLPAGTPPVAAASTSVSAPPQKEAKVENASTLSPEEMKNLMFEWARTDDPKAEIVLTLKSANGTSGLLQIQEWHVEKSDRTVLLMGRKPEFRGELPPGTYNVTVKARRDENSPVVTLRGSIKVTTDTDTHQVLVAAAAQRN